jgi:hypothetical protein
VRGETERATTKSCPACETEKPLSDFNPDLRKRDWLFSYCRAYWNRLKRTRYRDKDADHKRVVRRNYRLDERGYEELFIAQDGRCAICGTHASETTGRGKRLQVDHCRVSNAVRELLCNSCNIGLGALKDDPARLRKAMEYLAKWR